MRLVARIEFPSTKAPTTATFFSKGRLFMSSIMLERSSSVKRNLLTDGPTQEREVIGLSPKLRPPNPRDWGVGMTVCIGAICDYGKSILLATDQMISAEAFSSDAMTLKIQAIHCD